MSDEEIVETLRSAARRSSPTQVAGLLGKLAIGGLTQGTLVTFFKRAFPEIPLKVLLDIAAWSRVSDGALTDEEFDEILRPWLGTA